MSWGQFWLFLHILIAILAFGPPVIAFPILGAMGGKEPAHINFALRVSELIEKRVTIPLAVAMPIVGTILVYVRNWDLWRSEWLIVSIVLYTLTFAFAVFVQNRWVEKLIHMTGMMPAPAGPPAEPGPGVAPVAGGESGPPPELMRLVMRVRAGGMGITLAIVAITLLMVWKPGGAITVGP